MNRSERISTIREIATRLSEEDWSLIDLTLSQFGLPTWDEWPGTTTGYITESVSQAADAVLVGLAAHLGYEVAGQRHTVEPEFWTPGEFRLFISHLSTEKEFAAELKTVLQMYHICAFVAHSDITPTQEWRNEILLALETTDALVALLTPGFHKSYWTDQEVGFVMGRGKLAVAVKLGEEPYGFIGRLQAFQGQDKSAKDLAREMFKAFVKHKQTSRAMAQAVVAGFEQSSSFDVAKRNVGLLEQVQYWEPQFERRVKKAVRENGQVKDSFGVPDRANRLIEKNKEEGA